MKRITLTLVTLLLCCINMIAQQRSESEAVQIAQEFFEKKGLTPKLSVVSHQKVESQIRKKEAASNKMSDSSQGFYIVNDDNNNCFVIISSDERMKPILGYSDCGLFDVATASESMLDLLSGYQQQYNYLVKRGFCQNAKKFSETKPAIAPLLKTRWNDKAPFNAKCPVINGDTCRAGGSPVIMAQVMHYYQYPQHGIGSFSYKIASTQQQISHDFTSDTYDWDTMLDDYYGIEPTQEQIDAVSNLIYSCGVSLATEYGVNASNINGNDMPYAFIHFFGYNPNLVMYQRDYFSDEEWYDVLDQELDEKRPVLYAGRLANDSGSQRVIVDGRDANGLYHVNWGMVHSEHRTYDGFYDLDALQRAVWEDGELYQDLGENYALPLHQSMICRISPNTVGTHEDVFYAKSFSLSASNVQLEQTVDFSMAPIYCSSTRSGATTVINEFMTNIGVGLFDKDFNFIQSLYSTNIIATMQSSAVKSSLDGTIRFDASTFQTGNQYYIAPYALVEGETVPTRIRTWGGKMNHYLATVTENKVELKLMGAADSAVGIEQVENSQSDNNAYYTLSGLRVEKPVQKGVYILNGKKVVK